MINYWMFQATPEKFNIRDRLCRGQPKITTWQANQHSDEIKEGDRAFVWACKGKEADAGLCAVLEVLCDPIHMDDLSFEAPFYRDQSMNKPAVRVICRIVATTWITREDMLNRKPELANLRNLRMPHNTNYRLDEDQARLLMELMGVW